MALQFRFKHGLERRQEGEDLLLADQRGRVFRLKAPSQSLLTILQRLDEGGGTLPSLMQGASSLAAIVDIGKEAGFVVSIDEVQKAQAELSNVELSDEDLDNVAGGFHACACI